MELSSLSHCLKSFFRGRKKKSTRVELWLTQHDVVFCIFTANEKTSGS